MINYVQYFGLILAGFMIGNTDYKAEPLPESNDWIMTDCINVIKEINSQDAKVVASQLQLCYKLQERYNNEL